MRRDPLLLGIALLGVGSAAIAVLLGGATVHFNRIESTPYSLGLDWFVISLFFSALTYSLRDFSRPKLTEALQKINRGEWAQRTIDQSGELIFVTAIARLFANMLVFVGELASRPGRTRARAALDAGRSRSPGATRPCLCGARPRP